MNLLIIIDLQREFINERTKNSMTDIQKLIKSNIFNDIVFTRFINSEDNPCYKYLDWKGCLTEESKSIPINTGQCKVFDKNTYSVLSKELKEYLDNNNYEKIYLCGIDADSCVLASAINLFENNYNVYVLKDYIYCMNGEERKNKGLEVISWNIGEDRIIEGDINDIR